MTSMTGYGFSSVKEESFQLEVELKGYNNRYLDIQHNINYLLLSYSDYIDREISKVCSRGRVDVTVRLIKLESTANVVLDTSLAESYHKAFSSLSALVNCNEATLSDYLSVEGIITGVEDRDSEVYKSALESALSSALNQFVSARKREGDATRADLERLGSSFKASNEKIASLVLTLDDYYKNAMLSRYKEFLSDDKIDENRLLQEIGSLLVKYSINEEQNRLNTHIKEYFRLLSLDEPVGKRLDFLCQEMNREVNTTASKSQIAEINLETVKMKDDLENIREQVRNIE